MATEALTLDAYVRVSRVGGREGPSFISPTVQRDRITAYCTALGHHIAEIHEELDESGARNDRPKLLEAISRVERRETDGVIVWKLDRFGRSTVDGIALAKRIQDAGGTLISVTDGFDLGTDTGRLMFRQMLSWAEFELDRIKANWHEAKRRAVERGVHPSAAAPFGYLRLAKGEPLTPDPETAPFVVELFERRATGSGPTELADWLRAQGAVTRRGRPFGMRAVKDILRNDVYTGVAQAGEFRNETAHEPLVSVELFQRAQWTGIQWRPLSDEPSLIRPLLRCAGCRYAMRAERRRFADGREAWYFTCRTRGNRTAWACGEVAAIKDDGHLEQTIVDAFFDALPAVQAQARQLTPGLGDLERAAERAAGIFEQWRDDTRVQEQLGMDAYLGGLNARKATLDEAVAQLEAERRRAGVAQLPFDVAALRDRWEDLSLDQRRRLLHSVITCVFVRGSSRTAPLDGRLRFVWRGESVDLPSRGDRGWVARPFVFDE